VSDRASARQRWTAVRGQDRGQRSTVMRADRWPRKAITPTQVVRKRPGRWAWGTGRGRDSTAAMDERRTQSVPRKAWAELHRCGSPDHAASHAATKIIDKPWACVNEPPGGVEPQTYALREIRSPFSWCSLDPSAYVGRLRNLNGRRRVVVVSGHEPGHDGDQVGRRAARRDHE
jgi:hypothetical protein